MSNRPSKRFLRQLDSKITIARIQRQGPDQARELRPAERNLTIPNPAHQLQSLPAPFPLSDRPGPRDLNAIRAIVETVAPTPVNILIGTPANFDVNDLAEVGVRRISVGSALARSAWGGFDRAARSLLAGSFNDLDNAVPFTDLNDLFSRGRTNP